MTFVGSSKVAQMVSDKCHEASKRVLAVGAKNNLTVLPECDIGKAKKDIVALLDVAENAARQLLRLSWCIMDQNHLQLL